VDGGADLPADAQAVEVVHQGEGLLNTQRCLPRPEAVSGTMSGDYGLTAERRARRERVRLRATELFATERRAVRPVTSTRVEYELTFA
jgi:hypothetical protein